jgi:hypothetical protein
MSTIEDRVAIKQLRRWCPINETHQDADDARCMWSDCLDQRETHRLRLRRMIICSNCQQGYFTMKDWDGHECHSAY